MREAPGDFLPGRVVCRPAGKFGDVTLLLRLFLSVLIFSSARLAAQACSSVVASEERIMHYDLRYDTVSSSVLPSAGFYPAPPSGTFVSTIGPGDTWLRVCLDNPTGEDYRGTLVFPNINARELTFYAAGRPVGRPYRIDGPWPFRGNLPEFPVSVPAGTRRTFHLRARLGRLPQPNRLELRSQTGFARWNHRWQLADGFVVAVIFLYFLATLVYSAVNRRGFFVCSAVYALALLLTAFAQAGLGMHLLAWSRADNDALLLLGAGLAALSLPVLFLQYADFPRVQSWLRRRWYVWLAPIVFALVLVFVPGALAGLLAAAPWLRFFLRIFAIVAVLLLAGLGLLVYELLRRPTVDGGLFLLAYGGFLLPPVLMVLVSNNLYDGGFGPRESFALAVVVQVTALSVLLFRRARAYYRRSEATARAAADARRESDFREAKNRLYGNLSHEFRTPLIIIRGLTEKLSGRTADKRLLLRHNGALLELVDQLLELDRLDDNRLDPVFTDGDLAAATRALLNDYAPLAEEAELTLGFTADPAVLPARYAKRFWRRIVVNLVGNALKFTPAGGRIEVRLARAGNRLRLSVTDTGVGMSAGELRRVFERFRQGAHDQRGSGIGLALVRELVARLDGDIAVESRPGAGTTFRVELPLLYPQPLPERYGGDARPIVHLAATDPTAAAFVRGTLGDKFCLTTHSEAPAVITVVAAAARLTVATAGGFTQSLPYPCPADDLLLAAGLALRAAGRAAKNYPTG